MQWRGSGFVVLSWWYLVAGVAAGGVLLMAFLDVRWGGRVVAGALLIGAVIRLVARPSRKAGGLTVRSRAARRRHPASRLAALAARAHRRASAHRSTVAPRRDPRRRACWPSRSSQTR